MAKAKKKKRHAQVKSKKPFIILVLLFLVGITLSLQLFFAPHANTSSSFADEGILEQQNNTIPSDVQYLLKKPEDVLGIETPSQPTYNPPKEVHVPILMYHYVEYVEDKGDTIRISLNTTPYLFEEEVKTLKNAGYTFMTNQELADVMDGKRFLPQKPILLTFDDGYRDFYTDAYPILKKYHVKATAYIISGVLDSPNYMFTSQVEEIAKDGLIEIAAHTVHHVWLKGASSATVTFEIAQSKKDLEKLIHKPIVSFAYPYGAFDVQAIAAVKKAGFRTAVSTIPGIDEPQANRYFLYRLRPGGRVGNDLLTWLTSVQNTSE